MPGPDPLPDPLVHLIAERFRVMGDPTRIKLLDRLRRAPATVGELTEATGAAQPSVSKHLALLHAAGIVSREREGSFVRYAICDPTVLDLCETVCGGLRHRLDALGDALGHAA